MGMIKEIDFRTAPRLCSEAQVREGARNLLVNCCEVKRGTELMIVNENGLVDPAVARIIEDEARALGARVHVLWADAIEGPDAVPRTLLAAVAEADVTLLNHLMAAVLRLVPFEGRGLKVMNPLTTWDQLGSEYARIPFQVSAEILKALAPQLAAAGDYQVTCPLGTDLRAPLHPKPAAPAAVDSFTLRTFPLSVTAVYSCLEASGRLAIRWVTPSTIRVMKAKGVILPSPVLATLEQGRMVDFDGEPAAVDALRRYLDTAGAEIRKDGYIVNSWHMGTHPACFTHLRPQDDLFGWILHAHGNPRLAHFHAIGEAPPGEGSIPLLDPTVRFGGKTLWEHGRLLLADDPAFRARIAAWGDPDRLLRTDPNVGV
jgi:hypothetical protein